MKNLEEELFNIVNDMGAILQGDIHVIDMSEDYPIVEGERKFRVYHKTGICFDIEKLSDMDFTSDEAQWDYYFYSEWDGFNPCNVENAIKILKEI